MSTMLISDLEKTNVEYNPVVGTAGGVDGSLKLYALTTYSDFYSGGRKFEANKKQYLRTKNALGTDSLDLRLMSCSYFTPHCGGIGDNLCGSGMQYPPTIEVLSDDDRAYYWRDLNENMDG